MCKMSNLLVVVLFLFFSIGTSFGEVTVQQLHDVTVALEEGEGGSLEKVVRDECLENRIRALKRIGELNKKRRMVDSAIPELVIRIATSKSGTAILSVERKLDSIQDWFFGGMRIYKETMDLFSLKRTIYAVDDKR